MPVSTNDENNCVCAECGHAHVDATIRDVTASGLLPVEVQEQARKIVADLDEYIQRRVTTTIKRLP